MNEKKIISLPQSEEFLAKFNDAETQKLFAFEGIELDDEKAQILMDALMSANKRAHDGEVMSEEDLKLVSGGELVRKALEFVILSALLVEGVRVAQKVKARGGLNSNIQRRIQKDKDILTKAEDAVVTWIAKP